MHRNVHVCDIIVQKVKHLMLILLNSVVYWTLVHPWQFISIFISNLQLLAISSLEDVHIYNSEIIFPLQNSGVIYNSPYDVGLWLSLSCGGWLPSHVSPVAVQLNAIRVCHGVYFCNPLILGLFWFVRPARSIKRGTKPVCVWLGTRVVAYWWRVHHWFTCVKARWSGGAEHCGLLLWRRPARILTCLSDRIQRPGIGRRHERQTHQRGTLQGWHYTCG